MLFIFCLISIQLCVERASCYIRIDSGFCKELVKLNNRQNFHIVLCVPLKEILAFKNCKISGWQKHQRVHTFFVKYCAFTCKPASL